MDKKALKKALVLFVGEIVFWLLAAIVIGAFKGNWRMLFSNFNFLFLAVLLSVISSVTEYRKNADKKPKRKDGGKKEDGGAQ